MTITVLPSRNEYTANAGQTIFNYTFKIFENTDLNVYVTPAGQECSDNDLTTAYTVSGLGDPAGGSITLNTPTSDGDLVTIVSAVPSERTTDYQNNGDFRPDTVNEDFDRVVSIVKKIEDKVSRSPSLSECYQGDKPLKMDPPKEGNSFLFDGEKFVNFVPSSVVPEIPENKVIGNYTSYNFNTISDVNLGLTVGGIIVELVVGNIVRTNGKESIKDNGGATYIVVNSGTGTHNNGLYINLDSGLQLELIPNGITNIEVFSANKEKLDSSNEAQNALNSGLPIAISNEIKAIGLEMNGDNQKLYFFGEGKFIRPSSITAQDILTVNGNNCVIYDPIIDGDGANDPGGDISQSLAGIRLQGNGNKVLRGLVYGVGKLLTSGDQGGNNQVGVGYTGASDDPRKPNMFIDCVAHTCGNYGFNPRENTKIIGGGTYNNGTNGIGNRFCSNFHVDGTYIGVQYQGNPDTDSVGITLDTESPTHPNYLKLSRYCSFRNLIIEDQESYSISCSFYTDTIFENITCNGDVLIQSSKPQVAPDLGLEGVVQVRNLTTDRSFTALNHQKIVLNSVTQRGIDNLDFTLDNCDECDGYNLTLASQLARFIRVDNLTIRKLRSTGFVSWDTIENLDVTQVDMEGTAPVTDQQAMRFSNTQGKCSGIIKRYGYPISFSSGASNVDLTGFTFIECGAPDGGTDQNACINFKNTSGMILNNLRFINCTNRALYATNASNFTLNSLSIDSASSCSVTVEGGCDSFVATGWTYLGTGTLRMFAGSSMDGSEVAGNHLASTITISAYPAGQTRFNGGVLQVWNGSAYVNA